MSTATVQLVCAAAGIALICVAIRRRVISPFVVQRVAIGAVVVSVVASWAWAWAGGENAARMVGKAMLLGSAALAVAYAAARIWKRSWSWGATGVIAILGFAAYSGWVLPRVSVGGLLGAVPTTPLAAAAPWLPEDWIVSNELRGAYGWELLGDRRRESMWPWQLRFADHRFAAAIPDRPTVASLESASRTLSTWARLDEYELKAAALAVQGIQHSDPEIRERAVRSIFAHFRGGKTCCSHSLARYASAHPGLAQSMLPLLEGLDERPAIAAMHVLSACGPDGLIAAHRLKQIGFYGPSWFSAYSARETLQSLGVQVQDECDGLLREISAPERDIRMAALMRLIDLSLAHRCGARTTLLALIRERDSETAIAAARAYAAEFVDGSPARVDELRTAVRARVGADSAAREGLLQVIQSLRTMDAELLALATADPSPWIRRIADELMDSETRRVKREGP